MLSRNIENERPEFFNDLAAKPFAMFSIRNKSEIRKNLLSEKCKILQSEYVFRENMSISLFLTDEPSILVERISKIHGKLPDFKIQSPFILDFCIVQKLNIIALLTKTHLWILPINFVNSYDAIKEIWVEIIKTVEPSTFLIELVKNNKLKKEDTVTQILLGIQIIKLAESDWKQIHFWENPNNPTPNGNYMIIISESGLFQWISLSMYQKELQYQLKLQISASYLIQTSFLSESYILICDTKNEYWKMWLSTKGEKSILQSTNWLLNFDTRVESDIMNVLSGYKLLTIQYIKYNMCGIILYNIKDSQISIFDCGNLDVPIINYSLSIKDLTNCSVGIIGKYLLIQDAENVIQIHSQNLLMGKNSTIPSKKKDVYYDWTYKDYSDLDSLFQTLIIDSSPSNRIKFDQVIYYETDDIAKLFTQTEPKALSCTLLRFFTDNGCLEIGMTPINSNIARHALITVESPYRLRQLEIYLQAAGYSLNEYLLKLSENLFGEGKIQLAFRYAVLSEKDPILILSEYLKYEILYPDIYKWVIQLLVFESKSDLSRVEQYILVLCYIIVKTSRADISPYIRFSEFKALFNKKPKYLQYTDFNINCEEKLNVKQFLNIENIKKIPWVLSIIRILYSSVLFKYIQEKESYLLAALSKLLFDQEKIPALLLSTNQEKSPSKDTSEKLDVINLEKEILNTQALSKKPIKFYMKTIPWLRERILNFMHLLSPQKQAELFIIKNFLNSTESNLFYQLKHQKNIGFASEFQNFIKNLQNLSCNELLQILKNVTFDFHILTPDKSIIKQTKLDQFLVFYNGLLNSMKQQENPSKIGITLLSLFENTALNFSQSMRFRKESTKFVDTLKKIRSNMAISHIALKSKYSHYYSQFMTPYLCTMILLFSKNGNIHQSGLEQQFNKLSKLILSKFQSVFDTKVITKLLIECKQFKLIAKIMAENSCPIESLQASFIDCKPEKYDEICDLAVSFLSVQRPVEFYIFILKFIQEQGDPIKHNFEEKLLNVFFFLSEYYEKCK